MVRTGLLVAARDFLQRAAFDGDEARAEALDAGIILVAGRLVDRALAAEFGFHRQDRGAVGLHAAVAAAFAHRLVDEQALRGLADTRLSCGGGAFRRRRSGRRSAPTRPGHSRSSRCTASMSLRSLQGDHRRQLRAVLRSATGPRSPARCACTPSAAICCAIMGTEICPSTGWPPVMATASL